MKRKNQIWIEKGLALSAVVLLFSQPALAAVVSTDRGPGSTDYVQSGTKTAAQTTASSGQKTTTLETTDAVVPTESYNKELGMFEQEFGNGRRMVTSVSNGSQVPDAVYIQVPDNALVRLERDGRVQAFQNESLISDPGYYVMLVSSTVVGSTKRADAVFRFRVLPPSNERENTGEYVWPKVTCGLEKTVFINKGLTLFTMSNLTGLLTDVPDTGESVTSAEFYFPPNVGYVITRDGTEVKYHSKEKFTEPGRYHIKLYAPSQAYEGDYTCFYESQFDFVIPSNADDSLLAASAQPVVSGGGSYSTGSSSGGSQADSYGTGSVNAGSEITFQSDMVTETYRSEVGLYEEQFSNGILFYTNVPDKSIVGGDVYLDIPADVGVKMKRDGKEIPFINKEKINEEGTYLLTLTSNTNLGDDKNIYQSFFHFRIQPGAAMAGEVSVNAAASLTGETEAGTEETLEAAENNALEETASGEPTSEETGSTAETTAEAESETNQYGHRKPDITAPPEGEGYDENQALYTYTFSDNTVFYASVPQEGISNAAVTLYLPDGGTGTIDTGSRNLELPAAVSVDQDGVYHAEVTSAGGETLNWDFRVLSGGFGGLEEIQAPKGYYIDSIVRDDNLLEDSQYTDVYPLAEDGTYTVSFQPYYAGYPEWFLVLARDSNVPELTFTGLDENAKATGKEVSFTCTDETAEIILMRGSKQVAVNGNVVTRPGKYTITCRDQNGNYNTYAFEIPSQANLMTICAVLLMVILTMGFMAYYKVYGEKFKVR